MVSRDRLFNVLATPVLDLNQDPISSNFEITRLPHEGPIEPGEGIQVAVLHSYMEDHVLIE